ncbi:hypothetical protein GF108_08570 [Phyllobacterium sp. SYP-B3895]|uniref:hypothetical protein n=1 Tax=Phyllobacterium sp. SYP-B3895 TaxID=2663240 RepID=UPI001299D66A|nr:hypothetical protein [Phyllobacterium sp. SYP-B3895]MRG55635.1 hypothetical protein [Phyllobacterium sp. SYP-B3895]
MTVARAIAALITACLLMGCSSAKGDWRARYNAMWRTERSCASGYYDCGLRTSNQASLHGARNNRSWH